MLCVEDALDGLRWAESAGGLDRLIARCEANLSAIARWVERTAWVDFLAEDAATRSCTSICLKLAVPALAKPMAALLEREGAAYDIAAYRDAPRGVALWGGPTYKSPVF